MPPDDPLAANAHFPAVYAELRALADRHFVRREPDQTLQPTALVHEAYVKLSKNTMDEFAGRTHFLAVAAVAMRQIIIDHARARKADKRGGAHQRITLAELDRDFADPVDVLALDEALTALAQLDPRQARIVELRFFAGLSVDDTAALIDASPSTVDREWRIAKAWLSERLTGAGP